MSHAGWFGGYVNATRLGCWSHARRKRVECLPKGIEDKNSKAAQAFADFLRRGNCVIFVLQTVVCDFLAKTTKNNELVEQIFAEDKRLEGLPEDEVYESSALNALSHFWSVTGSFSEVFRQPAAQILTRL